MDQWLEDLYGNPLPKLLYYPLKYNTVLNIVGSNDDSNNGQISVSAFRLYGSEMLQYCCAYNNSIFTSNEYKVYIISLGY